MEIPVSKQFWEQRIVDLNQHVDAENAVKSTVYQPEVEDVSDDDGYV